MHVDYSIGRDAWRAKLDSEVYVVNVSSNLFQYNAYLALNFSVRVFFSLR